MRFIRSITLSVACGPTKRDRWQIHVKPVPAGKGAAVLAQGRRAVIERAVRQRPMRRSSRFRTLYVSVNVLDRLDDAGLRNIMTSLDRLS